MTSQKWLLIDFDNTMMETERHALPSLIARFNDLYGGRISHPLTLDIFKAHFHGMARDILCENLSKYFGIPVDRALLYENREWFMMTHMQGVEGGIRMADGLIDALDRLAANDWQFALVSNNPVQRALAAMRFAANGHGGKLARHLGTSFFEAGDIQKPKPDVYLHAMRQLAVSPHDCLAIEDSMTGARAARAAGCRTIGFTGLSDSPETAAIALRDAGCEAVLPDWAAIADYLSDQT